MSLFTLNQPAEHGQRFDLEPLARKLNITLGAVGGQQPGQLPEGLAEVAERLGVTHRTAQRLHEHGLTWLQADHYAVAVGLPAMFVWPDWDLHAPGEEDLYERHCRCKPEDRRLVDEWCDRCGRHVRHVVHNQCDRCAVEDDAAA